VFRKLWAGYVTEINAKMGRMKNQSLQCLNKEQWYAPRVNGKKSWRNSNFGDQTGILKVVKPTQTSKEQARDKKKQEKD